MNTTLDYATRTAPTPHPLWPALVLALVACPAASVAAAILGCQQALGSGWLSPANFRDSAVIGLVFGVLGGAIVAGTACAARSQSMPVSIVGSLIVSGGSGVATFLLASMAAAC